MFGRNWQSADATIVATKVAVQTQAGYEDRLEYVADVNPAGAPPFRVTLQEPRFIKGNGAFVQPPVGAVVGVLFDPKSKKAKFDTTDQRILGPIGADAGQAAFEAAQDAAPGTPAGGLVAGEVPVMSGADVASLADALRSGEAGDPSARLAKLDELKAKGLVSDAEYQAQRQKIIGSI